MALVDDIGNKLRKHYIVPNIKCSNCGHIQEVKIPKGQKREEWLTSEGAICENCGVSGMMASIPIQKEKRDDGKNKVKYW